MAVDTGTNVHGPMEVRGRGRFVRRSYQASQRTLVPDPNLNEEVFVIGPSISFSGILKVDGVVRLESRVEADIKCRTLLIAPHSAIDGVIVADRVEIYGFVRGEVFCNHVIVKDNSRVEAELNYRSLVLEAGGLFEGRSRRHPDPMSFSPPFE